MEQKWYKIYKIMKEEIKRLSFDTKYKSERKLSEQYNVHRVTIKKAIEQLVRDGYLYRIDKRGTFISKKRFFSGDIDNLLLQSQNHELSNFKFINKNNLGESLTFTKRYFSEHKLVRIEEFFIRKDILPYDWNESYYKEIGLSLYKFIEKHNLASINFSKKEIKTFSNNNKHFIMVNTDIYDYNNNLIAITTLIQPFNDFSIKLLDYSVQSELLQN